MILAASAASQRGDQHITETIYQFCISGETLRLAEYKTGI